MRSKTTIPFVIVLISTVFVLGAIIYGVMTEPGLLNVCWKDGQARYVLGEAEDYYGACKGDEELVWPKEQLPLTVAAIEDSSEYFLAPGSSGRTGLDVAIKNINKEVGCTLLVPVAAPTNAAMVARVGAKVDFFSRRVPGKDSSLYTRNDYSVSPFGWTQHFNYGRDRLHYGRDRLQHGRDRLRCDLFVPSIIDNLYVGYLIAYHELLHCVGLAHQPRNRKSIMYPFTYRKNMWDNMQRARILNGQRRILRNLYCPNS